MLEKILESYPKPSGKIRENIPQALNQKSCIYGAIGSGKTDFVLHYFTNPNFHSAKKLYIDCEDPRLSLPKDIESLKEFIQTEKISILILDNFCDSMPIDLSLELPHLILISHTPCTLRGFENYEIPPLTFAEFLHIHKLKEEEGLNLYLKFGNTLEQVSDKSKGMQLKLFAQDSINFWILKNFILNLGQRVSPHQIYTKLKKEGNLSKDRLYEYCNFLQHSRILFWLEKFEHPSATKKLYFWDFTLRNVVSYGKNFKAFFENMVFLELRYHFCLEFFHTDKLDFYVPSLSLGILCAPFIQTLQARLNKLGKERELCDSLLIISLSDESLGENLGMPYRILPFSTFATSNKSLLSDIFKPLSTPKPIKS